MTHEDIWTEATAARYDESSAAMATPEVLGPTIDFLAARAAGGAALELAVGTGRVALPLSARGVPVAGIELSAPMAARLAAKPGAERVPVTMGDMSTATAPGRFRLVYLVYNGITNLMTQDAQVACFQNAARHLEPGGAFVCEVFVPQLRRLPPGEVALPFDVSDAHLGFDRYDVVHQTLVSHHYTRETDGSTSTGRSPHRYVWPAELDLMARIAGMAPTERWADFTEAPFEAESPSHVSVWRTPG
ncbi:class I SAM-dependent methyltransferase [Cellulomonas triticagri]|uniref:Class I SAM-dependent methyltransferase n=1 Tax=Cellulomonas triticagri TaxID=2483352 RepID=A0A3M2JKZ6_9CELL|nr:class I SAM-dependent methyltransferase [Cellulomonas triticagri]RMI13794.1 class I SAM-dependent methyltransferase [Cellulomonas triticagri]